MSVIPNSANNNEIQSEIVTDEFKTNKNCMEHQRPFEAYCSVCCM